MLYDYQRVGQSLLFAYQKAIQNTVVRLSEGGSEHCCLLIRRRVRTLLNAHQNADQINVVCLSEGGSVTVECISEGWLEHC